MGCSVSSIENESSTICSDAQREKAKVSPGKVQELQECSVLSLSELPLDGITKNEGSVHSLPLLNNVSVNEKGSRPPSSKSKQSIKSRRSNNADPINGSPIQREKPTSANSNNSRKSSNSKKDTTSPSASLKLESNASDEVVHNGTKDGLEEEVADADNLEVLSSDMKESEENGECDQAQGSKEILNREFPSASEKYRAEMPFVESNNENHSEDEGIGFEKLDTISIQEDKKVESENSDQLVENGILQTSYWEDLGINIDAPSAKNPRENDATGVDDLPEVELMLPNADEEKEVKEESVSERNEDLLTQDSTSKELRIDIHVSEEALQQSEAGEPKEAAYDNDSLRPSSMKKQENTSKNQNDDSAISLSDLLSDLDSSEDAPCSLAASSSGLVLPRPSTSKPREDISNSDFLNVPCDASENGDSKYIDTIEIDTVNEVNNNPRENSVEEAEAETTPVEQHNEAIELGEEELTRFMNATEQSNHSNELNSEGGHENDLVAVDGRDSEQDLVAVEGRDTEKDLAEVEGRDSEQDLVAVEGNDSEKDLVAVEGKDTETDLEAVDREDTETYLEAQSAHDNETEDILPVELNNETLMASNKEEALLEASDENFIVLSKDCIDMESISSQNEHKVRNENIEPIEQVTAVNELQENEGEFGTSEEHKPEDNNNNAGIKNNDDSDIINNKEKAVLIRQNAAALSDHEDDVQIIQDANFEHDPNNAHGNVYGLQESQIVETEKGNGDLKCNTDIENNELSKEEECLFEWSSEDERIERLLKDGNEPNEKNKEIQNEKDPSKQENNDLQDESDHFQEDNHNVNNEIQTESGQLQNENNDFQLESDQLQEKHSDFQEDNNEANKKCRENEKETENELMEHTQHILLTEGVLNGPDMDENCTDGVTDCFIETRKKEANLVEQIEVKIDELLNNSEIISEVAETAAEDHEKIKKIIRFVLPNDPIADSEPINTDITSSELTVNESSTEAHDHSEDSKHRQGEESCENPYESDEAIREQIISDLSREVSFKGSKLGDNSDDAGDENKVNNLNISKQNMGSQEDHLRTSSRQSVASLTLKLSDISNLSGMEIKQIGRINSQKSSSNIDAEITESERTHPLIGF